MQADEGKVHPDAHLRSRVGLLHVLTPLVAQVGWASWRVGVHTVAQAVVATVLALVITLGTFWVMGVPVALPR